MTAAHVVVNAAILFVLYRYALAEMGVERLGVWSLVLATASTGTLLQLGFTTSVVKFVAKYLALKDELAVARIVETSVISIGLLIGLLLAALYPVGSYALAYLIKTDHLTEALAALPYALGGLWLFLVGYVYQSSLDGYQRTASRKVVLVIAGLVQFGVAFVLIPTEGILGFAYAQIAQNLTILFGTGWLLKRQLPMLNWIPRRWNRRLFKEMLGFALNLQVVSICEMLADPITKALVTKFGGLAMTGYYDLATRMWYQVRGLVVLSTEVLIPTIASLSETNREAIRKVYSDAYGLSVFITIPFYALTVIATPLIARIWIGSYESTFIALSGIIAAGWFFNTVSSPANVVQLGVGRLRWIVVASLVMASVNAGLGALWGWQYGGLAVVAAWAVARLLSGTIIILSYHLGNGVSLRALFGKEHFGLIIGAAIALYGFFQVYFGDLPVEAEPLMIALTACAAGAILLGLPGWFHPMRRRLQSFALSKLSRRARSVSPA